MDENLSRHFVETLSDQSKEFCIIGLTGKVKSGTSKVCDLLTSLDFYGNVPPPSISERGSKREFLEYKSELREYNLIHDYLDYNWKPFVELSAATVIVSFLLDEDIKSIRNANDGGLIGTTIEDCCEKDKIPFSEKVLQRTQDTVRKLQSQAKTPDEEAQQQQEIIKQECESLLGKIKQVEDLFSTWKRVLGHLNAEEYDHVDAFVFCHGILPVLEAKIREMFKNSKSNKYTPTFQDFGNSIRATGHAFITAEQNRGTDARCLFSLPRRINQFIKVLRNLNLLNTGNQYSCTEKYPTFVVIHSLKNVFEAYYFKKRYSAFYLLAVSCDEKMRQSKFRSPYDFQLTDLRENLSSGKKLYNKAESYRVERGTSEKIDYQKSLGLNDAESQFISEVMESGNTLRKNAYDHNMAPFILQDVMTCIENADIFVTRDYSEADYRCDYQLIRSLGRMVALILHPGILTPTKLECCMQIAMTAKLNSGCLSRQVGAVVTDSEYNILSLGWNDAPCGVESCIRRNLFDLLEKRDSDAYSNYELSDEQFRKYLDEMRFELDASKGALEGRPLAFCFKDIYQDLIRQRDQIYTRALHGEERAIASCGNDRAKGGYLFTTSSPCELCAKKAKEANISKIYYIEQYPGISHTHIIDAGDKDMRARYEFFVGAVGLAYIKFYTPLMPYKDELAAFNFSPVSIHKKFIDSQKPKKDGDEITPDKKFVHDSNLGNDVQCQQERQ